MVNIKSSSLQVFRVFNWKYLHGSPFLMKLQSLAYVFTKKDTLADDFQWVLQNFR